jgi:hypothetical protein
MGSSFIADGADGGGCRFDAEPQAKVAREA